MFSGRVNQSEEDFRRRIEEIASRNKNTRDTSEKSAFLYWIKPGESITIQDFILSDGMVYIGNLDSELSQINPYLKVAHDDSVKPSDHIGYVPAYRNLSPAMRWHYLNWLTSGRRDPRIHIGYVFIFVYGIERRILELVKYSNVKDELLSLRSELNELKEIYNNRRTFTEAVDHTLQLVRILLYDLPGYEFMIVDPCIKQVGLPVDYEIALAQLCLANKPLPADYALALLFCSADFDMPDAATRIQNEFRVLFNIYYHREFGKGLYLKQSYKPIKYLYRPVNSSISNRAIDIELAIDKTALTRSELKSLMEIAWDAGDQLQTYCNRLNYLRDNDKSMDAIVALPEDLLQVYPNDRIDTLLSLLNNAISDTGFGFINGLELIKLWSGEDNHEIPKYSSTILCDFLGNRGIGLEPDPRYSKERLTAGTIICIYCNVNTFNITDDSELKSYRAIIALAAKIVSIDGFTDDDLKTLNNRIALALNADESISIRGLAYLYWLLRTEKYPSVNKSFKSTITPAHLKKILACLVYAAALNRTPAPETMKVLNKIASAFKISAADIANAVFSISHNNDIPVAQEQQSVREEKTNPAKSFDHAIIQKKVDETRQAALLLNALFKEDEDTVAIDVKPSVDPYHELMDKLSIKEEWTRDDYNSLCQQIGLMPDGAIDYINEMAYDNIGDPVIDGDTVLTIDLENLCVLKNKVVV